MDDAQFKLARRWYDHKTSLMEVSLGKEHDHVMHAIIPFDVGGTLDLYYFSQPTGGAAIATKEVSELPNVGPSNDIFRSYELVMFTRESLDLAVALDRNTSFGKTHRVMNSMLNVVARYSCHACLNPHETCEFPQDMETIGGRCLIFDKFASHSDEMVQNFGLLALIEIFRSEMDFARKRGGASLIKRLKASSIWPYSDLNRKPVA